MGPDPGVGTHDEDRQQQGSHQVEADHRKGQEERGEFPQAALLNASAEEKKKKKCAHNLCKLFICFFLLDDPYWNDGEGEYACEAECGQAVEQEHRVHLAPLG